MLSLVSHEAENPNSSTVGNRSIPAPNVDQERKDGSVQLNSQAMSTLFHTIDYIKLSHIKESERS